MLTVPNSPHLLIGQLVKWNGSRGPILYTRARCLGMAFPHSHFPASRIPQPEIPSFPKNDTRHRSSRPLPTLVPGEKRCGVSREHSGDVEVEVVLDIDRDELDNEIQDPFFESFRWIFSSQILLGRHLSDDFLEIQVCRIAVYSDHSHDALHEFEAEFPLLNGSCLKGNLLRGPFENTSSPSGHRFPLSLIIAALNFLSCSLRVSL